MTSPPSAMDDSAPNANANASISSSHLRVNVDDAPPPYSETDIYSTTSPGARSQHSTSGPPSAVPGPADDAASRISSSSTGDPVIFTPPLTPRTSSNANILAIPPSPSAAYYFDGRPALAASPRLSEPLVHRVVVQPGSKPDDLPYPADWANRDITAQDWATFVNFLIPHHDTESNEALLGEKAKSEDNTSAEKYRTVAGLETEIESKKANMTDKGVSDGERRAVEKELESLLGTLETLRVEADETYARELASEGHT
ncbi:hypothetical protein AUP68_01940 [Ilyonectria robusta]